MFSPADLAEDVDLDPDRRREILFADAQVDRWTHWEVLGIPWNASAAEANAAYLARVKVFHPDRYASARLGKFRPRLERVFRRLTEARAVLTDDARRAEYARKTAPPEEFARLELRRLEDERRAAERRARLARTNPLVARASHLAEVLTRAKDALAAGQYVQAANDFQLVLGMDPDHAEARALAAEARRKAAEARGAERYERGIAAAAIGSWAAAVRAFREALLANPLDARPAVHGVRAALELGDSTTARELGEAAVRAAPRSGASHEALGLALAAGGDGRAAKKAFERALELDPALAAAKERLKKLRWSFLG
ncbi:MAG TPA: DnaJ domain-containing protein [Anaeromyxobacteraceae bacterium]|nr:DnaJ domain-containing protein [Anaeromyxobacteraceae bacterium]